MWKKWMVLTGLWIAALVLASFHGGRIAYMLLYFVTAVPVVSLIYTIWMTLRFKFFQRIGSASVVKGEPVDYYFALRNEDRFFYAGIEVEFLQDYSGVIGMEDTPFYQLAGGEGKEIATRLCCNYRGEYAVGARRFYLSDYLRLFRIPYRIPEPLKITVLPRVVPWKYEREILEEPEGRLRGRKSRTGEPDVQVRNYEIGDEMRQIHWKAAAKTGKLMSRDSEEQLRQGLVVLLDLQPWPTDREAERLAYEDEMMEQAVSLVYTCIRRRIPVTVICESGGRRRYRISDHSRWREFYEVCGKLHFSAAHPLYQMSVEASLLGNLQYAVFLTGTVQGDLYDWIKRDFAGVKSSVIAVSNKRLAAERALFEGGGIRFFQTWSE